MTAATRDPAALPRLGWTLLALVLLWPLLRLTDFRPAALFEAGNLQAMGQIGRASCRERVCWIV